VRSATSFVQGSARHCSVAHAQVHEAEDVFSGAHGDLGGVRNVQPVDLAVVADLQREGDNPVKD
jgi:hypothetical protein